MPQTQRSGPRHHSRPASNYTDSDGTGQARQSPEPWWTGNGWRDAVAWWTSVPLAYAAGLADGAALERARREPLDDQVHRTAVRRAVRIVEQGEHRDRADRRGAAA